MIIHETPQSEYIKILLYGVFIGVIFTRFISKKKVMCYKIENMLMEKL